MDEQFFSVPEGRLYDDFARSGYHYGPSSRVTKEITDNASAMANCIRRVSFFDWIRPYWMLRSSIPFGLLGSSEKDPTVHPKEWTACCSEHASLRVSKGELYSLEGLELTLRTAPPMYTIFSRGLRTAPARQHGEMQSLNNAACALLGVSGDHEVKCFALRAETLIDVP